MAKNVTYFVKKIIPAPPKIANLGGKYSLTPNKYNGLNAVIWIIKSHYVFGTLVANK